VAEESLLTAARRVVQYFNIDMNKGGLITEKTQLAVETLDIQVGKALAHAKATKTDIYAEEGRT
jgi:bisphosphoglycerate-independent phosphoglycerate mutase (AlkP superfamily)